jgi:hypothetical protein
VYHGFGARDGEWPLVLLMIVSSTIVTASPTSMGLKRILDARKRYGDGMSCEKNTGKSHILLMGPVDAAMERR